MFDNRITRLIGCEIPILQAPMGYISRSQLASAVANAGAIGMIETSSGELDAVRGEIVKMRELAPGKPFAVNIAQAGVTVGHFAVGWPHGSEAKQGGRHLCAAEQGP